MVLSVGGRPGLRQFPSPTDFIGSCCTERVDVYREFPLHNPKVVSSNLTPATKKFLSFSDSQELRNHPN
jgi:hypothetical protein